MARKKPLSLISFDLDDTLYSTTDFARLARENSLRAMIATGLAVELSRASAELNEVILEFGSNDQHHLDRLLQRLPPDCQSGINPAILVAAGVDAYHDTVHQHMAPYADVHDSLRRLRGRGFRLGVITQGLTVKQASKLVRLGVLPFLDKRAVFFSEQIGFSKANPKFFRRAAEALGVYPAQCLHVGDRPDHDVDSAHAAGWLTVLNRRSGRYKNLRGQIEPDYTILNLGDLVTLAERDFTPA